MDISGTYGKFTASEHLPLGLVNELPEDQAVDIHTGIPGGILDKNSKTGISWTFLMVSTHSTLFLG